MYDPAAGQADYLADAGDLLEGLHLGGVGIWRWRVHSDELLWTRNLEEVSGPSPHPYDGTLESFRRNVHPEDMDAVWGAISEAVANGTPYRFVYRTVPKPDGSLRWIEARGGLVGKDGESWLTGACLDVTDRVQGEMELQRRLRQQKAIEEFGSFAFGEPDFQVVADRAAAIASEVLDVPLTKILQFTKDGEGLHLIAGVGWRENLVGKATIGVDRESHAGLTLLEGKPVVVEDLSAETRFSRPELLVSHGVVSGICTIIPGVEGRPFGVFGAHTNVRRRFDQADTEFLSALANIVANSARQIATVEHRLLLIREMAHRAGNVLQLVNTLAHRTFSPDRDLEEARRSFSNRLASLSRANYLIAKGGWSQTRFSELAAETLEPFRERVRLAGDDVLLPPELCFDLGLVLHELSTNAVKYGSFASEEGIVDLRWFVSRDGEGRERFHVEWLDGLSSSKSERGTGFGSKLMRLVIERKWGGAIEPPAKQGYRFAFALPLAAMPETLSED